MCNLGRNSKVTLQWVPEHAGALGIEEAGTLARKGASPRVTGDRRQVGNNLEKLSRDEAGKITSWEFGSKEMHSLYRKGLRQLTGFLRAIAS